MPNNPDFSYRNNDGKRVAGAAALTHHIYTVKGGVQKYNDEVGAAYIQAFINAHSDAINKALAEEAKKSKFKVV